MLRPLLLVAGTLCVILGVLGIFLPLLPTTPFLLLAAAAYARSSEKFYDWLINHKWFGEYIQNFRSGKGIPMRAKIKAIVVLWISIAFSMIYATDILWVRLVLGSCGLGITIFLIRFPTLKQQ